MSLNPQEIGNILAKHLDELAPGEFLANLKEFCPYLFEEDNIQHQNSQHHSVISDIPPVPVVENDRSSPESVNLNE
jgi:hypothetical protein